MVASVPVKFICSIFLGLFLFSHCANREYSEQDIIIQYHLNKVKTLSLIDIPDEFQLESYTYSDENSYFQIRFQLLFNAVEICEMSDQFRKIRRQASGPGWGKIPLGWEYFHQPYMDEQFKLSIDTISNKLEYSYIMAY